MKDNSDNLLTRIKKNQTLDRAIWGLIPASPVWLLFLGLELAYKRLEFWYVFPLCAVGIQVCFIMDKRKRCFDA